MKTYQACFRGELNHLCSKFLTWKFNRRLDLYSVLCKMVPTFICSRGKDNWGGRTQTSPFLLASVLDCGISLVLLWMFITFFVCLNPGFSWKSWWISLKECPRRNLPPCGRTRTFSGEQKACLSLRFSSPCLWKGYDWFNQHTLRGNHAMGKVLCWAWECLKTSKTIISVFEVFRRRWKSDSR